MGSARLLLTRAVVCCGDTSLSQSPQHQSALAFGLLQAGGLQGTPLRHPFGSSPLPGSQGVTGCISLQSKAPPNRRPSSTCGLSAPFAALASVNVTAIIWILQCGLFNPDLPGVPGQALVLLAR